MAAFNLNVFTPNGVVIKGLKCEDLLIPTCRGEINVLKDHTHVLTELETGVITAKTDMGARHFTVTAGLCKILKDDVTILAMTSENPEDIDVERAKSAQAKAESMLSGKEIINDVQVIKFRRKLERSRARLRAANLK